MKKELFQKYYKLSHQTLSLTGINFTRKTIIGITELTLLPTKDSMRYIWISCKQCCIYKIVLNDVMEVAFQYFDPLMDICQEDSKTRNIEFLNKCLSTGVTSVNPELGRGEIVVTLPSEAQHMIQENVPLRITMEFSLEKPSCGLHFIVPEGEGTMAERGAHMFSYGTENSSRLWFPCVDSWSEVCTWKLEFTVDQTMTAVSSGDLTEVVYTTDMRRKTYHYSLTVPTSAPNIALAVGPFTVYVDPYMNELTHFCLPQLLPVMKACSKYLHQAFEFFEEMLSTRYPYSCYKQVYVDEAYSDLHSYATMSIVSQNLLCSSRIIDQVYDTREAIVLSVAHQFFGCFLTRQNWADSWLCEGAARYLTGLYMKKYFGFNHYKHWIQSELKAVVEYEEEFGSIILDPSSCGTEPKIPSLLNSRIKSSSNNSNFGSHGGGNNNHNNSSPLSSSGYGSPLHNRSSHHNQSNHATSTPYPNDNHSPGSRHHQDNNAQTNVGKDIFYFSVKNPHACSPHYIEMYYRKSQLVMRMLEIRIGQELMMQVFNKHLSLGVIASEQKIPAGWSHLLLSTATFTKQIFIVTGKDITTFCDQWVRQGGHSKFKMKFHFNRKRNIVEMTVEQPCINETGIRRYDGPLVVWIQELDGTFKHTVQIEHTIAKKEIVCHSKSRRNKKKKIPLCTGEEVDMDLSHLDADSPVLWLRLDPDLSMMRSVIVHQPDNQWQYQLRHEKDVTAQIDAINALHAMAKMGNVTLEMRNTLNAVLENENLYYKVRCASAKCLTTVANSMANTWNGPPAMMQIFRKMFGSYSCPNIIKQHDFDNLQYYFILQTLPIAMAGLRNIHQTCPPEVLSFLFDLFKYSDNTKNQMSDNYYRSALVDALAASVSPTVVQHDPANITPDSLTDEYRKILSEIVRYMNLEKILPCYKLTVTVSCLKAIRVLQKNGHLPPKSSMFMNYAAYPVFIDVRLSAIDQLIDFLPISGSFTELNFLLDLAENDPLPRIRYEVLRKLALNKPFKMGEGHKLDTEFFVERLWAFMNSHNAFDSRIRGASMDLYYALYGRRRPSCIPASSSDPVILHTTPHNAKNQVNPMKQPTDRSGAPLIAPRRLASLMSGPGSYYPPLLSEPSEEGRAVGTSSPSGITILDDNGSMGEGNISHSNVNMPAMGMVRVKEEVVDVSEEDTPSMWPGDFNPPMHKIKQEMPDVCIKEEVIVDKDGRGAKGHGSGDGDGSDSSTSLPDEGSNLTSSRHGKSKKRKKDKKHKKHKRQKQEKLPKLDKFVQDENLSSGSSNPPSPSSNPTVGGGEASSSHGGASNMGGGPPTQFPTIYGTIAGVKLEKDDEQNLSEEEP